MSFSKKIRVGVLRGGPSSEYEVSLKSGETVLSNLPMEKYEPIDVFISRDGIWHIQGIPKKVSDMAHLIDVAFIALHGSYGEDGRVQRDLSQFQIPFTGSNSFESAVAMNKDMTKKTISRLSSNIKMAFHKLFRREEVEKKSIYALFREIPNPSVVKPVASGSSVGVSIVKSYTDLEQALNKAFDESDTIIIEEYIPGIEATCGVIDNFRGEKLYALPPVEIIPSAHFFDYDAKYGGGSREVCPGNFDHDTKQIIQDAAREAHKILGLKHYSRSDFMVHPTRGVFFLETNTLPGLTSESLLPKSLHAVGTDLSQFLDHVITLART
jgi:D-alanine-D-alanine ligase